MVRLLLFVSALMILFLLGYGDYNFLTFIFFLGLAVIPPLIFKYYKYPERSIFIYLLLWITFPKYIRYLPIIGTYDLPGINYFDIIQAIFTFHIVFLLFKSGYKNFSKFKIPKPVNKITLFFIITVMLTTIFGFIRYFYFVPKVSHIEIGNLVEYSFMPFTGVIFFLGLFAFINKYKHLEKIIYIFSLAGVLLLLEHLLLVQLDLFDALKFYAFSADQVRFNSLIYGSYDIKGLFCVLSVSSFFYLAFSKRKYYLLIFPLLLIFPIITTYQRTSYIGYTVAIIVFFLIYFKQIKQFTRILIIMILILITTYISFNQKSFTQSLDNLITGNQMVRQDSAADNQSFFDRVGLWYRAADLFIYSFPFGLGEGTYGVYSTQKSVPNYSTPLVIERAKNGYRAISTYKTAGTHNVYIQFISEYNILGLLVLYFFIRQLLRYIRRRKIEETNKLNNIYRATIISMICSLGIMSLFDSAIRLYFLYGLLMFFAYFISRVEDDSKIHIDRNY